MKVKAHGQSFKWHLWALLLHHANTEALCPRTGSVDCSRCIAGASHSSLSYDVPPSSAVSQQLPGQLLSSGIVGYSTIKMAGRAHFSESVCAGFSKLVLMFTKWFFFTHTIVLMTTGIMWRLGSRKALHLPKSFRVQSKRTSPIAASFLLSSRNWGQKEKGEREVGCGGGCLAQRRSLD